MEKTDKFGKTEAEFLSTYDRTAYDRPSFTADTVLFADGGDGLEIMLVRRGGHPCIGQWALPGGFVENGESAEEAAARELMEEAGLTLDAEQFITVSTPDRDPRGWTVTACFMGLLAEPTAPKAGDDAADARWFMIDYLASGDVYKLILKSGSETATAELKVVRGTNGKIDINKTKILVNNGIAFDHAKIILYAIEAL